MALRFGGLFSGIGGFELGLTTLGHEAIFMSDNDLVCSSVLAQHFSGTPNLGDIIALQKLPRVDVLTAGFPCQNYSLAGRNEGLRGQSRVLLDKVFELIGAMRPKPQWLIFENVAFILHLHGGAAVKHLIRNLEAAGYRWAYRILDTAYFGLPQRRRRWFMVASLDCDPESALLDDADEVPDISNVNAYGFYWTEGNRGIGWASEMIPPLKGGSSYGIPSAPAIWFKRDNTFATPEIRDAERLQGFPADWTALNDADGARRGSRWRLVGNAVSVPVVTWLGQRIIKSYSHEYVRKEQRDLRDIRTMPDAASGQKGRFYPSEASPAPSRAKMERISDFLRYEAKPLSARAASGFYNRAINSTLRIDSQFLDSLRNYVNGASDHVRFKAASKAGSTFDTT